MMMSVYLKDSVLTTQTSTNINDLKPEITKIRIFSMKNLCVLYFWSAAIQKSKLFLKKELSLLGAAPNRQTLKAVIFSSGPLLHPPSPVIPICLRTARGRPNKITFLKNVLAFNLHH